VEDAEKAHQLGSVVTKTTEQATFIVTDIALAVRVTQVHVLCE
jgi:hypothetical protein